MDTIDRLMHATSILNESADYVTGQQINLNTQENYICLTEDAEQTEPHLVKQKTNPWHDIRNAAKVTGTNTFWL